MKISEYPETETLEDTDSFVVETGDGTKQIKVPNMQIPNGLCKDPAIVHRNTYRGKNLGNEFTDAQKEAISSGTFEDLYVGDYWEDGNIKWRIVDINFYFSHHPQVPIDWGKNHLVIFPDDGLYKKAAFTTSTDLSKGYYNSQLRSSLQTTGLGIVSQFFGSDHIYTLKSMIVSSAIDTSNNKYAVSNVIAVSDAIILPTNMNLLGGDPKVSNDTSGNARWHYPSQFAALIANPYLIQCGESGTIYYTLDLPTTVNYSGSAIFNDIRALANPEIPVRPIAVIV